MIRRRVCISRRRPFQTGLRGLLARSYYDVMNAYAVRYARHIITVSEQAKRDILRFHPHLPPAKVSGDLPRRQRRFQTGDPCGTGQGAGATRSAAQLFSWTSARSTPARISCGYWVGFHVLRITSGVDTRTGRRCAPRSTVCGVLSLLGALSRPRCRSACSTTSRRRISRAWYSGARALVLPSEHESFGFPVLEAFVCGTPVITSNTSALPEIAGEAALLVDPHSVEEIADACRRLSNDDALRQELIEKGLRRARDFSWRRCAEQTLAVYEGVFSGRLR